MVQFGNPVALWLLTLVLPIVLLYLLKRRRKDTVVPSILLWAKVVDDVRAQTPFQKLRSSLLLWLQTLAVVLFTAILSRPYVPAGKLEAGRWIFVLDTSASMKATDVSPDRFQDARNKLLEFVDSLPPEEELMLLSMSGSVSVEQAFHRNRAAFSSRLGELKSEALETNWPELRKILEPLVKEKPVPGIIIASDFANFDSRIFSGIPFQALTTGRNGSHLGIIGVTLQPVPEDRAEYLLFFRMKNFGRQTGQGEAVVFLDRRILDAFELRFSAGEELTRSLRIRIEKESQIRIEMNPDDVFSPDNDYTIIAYPRKKIGVRLMSENPFLQHALRSLSGVEMTEKGVITVGESAEMRGPGISFVDGAEPAGPVVGWNSLHPAFQSVDASLWKFSHQAGMQLPDHAVILLETTEGPAVYAIDDGGTRRCFVGFGLGQSNLPLLAGLPIFLQNSLDWIQQGIEPPLPVRTGGPYRQEGEYEVEGRKTYVNLASLTESDISPRRPTGMHRSDPAATALRRDLSSWFVLGLIAVLTTEWWLFHRRTGE